jgi:hypothetical protein
MGLIDISVKILHSSWWEDGTNKRYEVPYDKLDWDLDRLYGDWKPANFPSLFQQIEHLSLFLRKWLHTKRFLHDYVRSTR